MEANYNTVSNLLLNNTSEKEKTEKDSIYTLPPEGWIYVSGDIKKLSDPTSTEVVIYKRKVPANTKTTGAATVATSPAAAASATAPSATAANPNTKQNADHKTSADVKSSTEQQKKNRGSRRWPLQDCSTAILNTPKMSIWFAP